jgi:chromosomal replication initiator protein
MSKTWEYCLKILKQNTPLTQYSIWIQPLKAFEKNNTLMLIAPNNQALTYLNKNLKTKIQTLVSQHNKNLTVDIQLNRTNTGSTHKLHNTGLFEDYTFDNLILGEANEIAYSASYQIANNVKSSPYNPFIIYGSSGLGKTHLMQAAGYQAQQNQPNLKILYVPLMDFVKNITASLRHNTIENVKNFYQSADLLLVDDIHLIAGKDKSQEEFFHIFNFLFSSKKQIIFTCDQMPKNITSLQDRLKTRFSQGLNLEITPPGLEMRAAILLKKSQNSKINIDLSEETALFIAGHITSNVRDLEGALLKLKAFADFSKTKIITQTVIETALKDLIKPHQKIIDINDIQKLTAKHYATTISDLSSKSRKQHIVLARQVAVYLAHELTNLSLSKIGKNFGNRDHSTILHAIKKIKNEVENNNEIKDDYQLIKLKLNGL